MAAVRIDTANSGTSQDANAISDLDIAPARETCESPGRAATEAEGRW
jgi:hypothetical protein